MERVLLPYSVMQGPAFSGECLTQMQQLRDLARNTFGRPAVSFSRDRLKQMTLPNDEAKQALAWGDQVALRLLNFASNQEPELIGGLDGVRNWHFFHSQVERGDLLLAKFLEVWHSDFSFAEFGDNRQALLWVPDTAVSCLELVGSRSQPGKVLCDNETIPSERIPALLKEDPDLYILASAGNQIYVLPESCYHRRRPIAYCATPTGSVENYGFKGDLI